MFSDYTCNATWSTDKKYPTENSRKSSLGPTLVQHVSNTQLDVVLDAKDKPQPVWPNLAKLRHCERFLKAFVNFISCLAKFLTYFCKYVEVIWQFFIVVNAQFLNKPSEHTGPTTLIPKGCRLTLTECHDDCVIAIAGKM